MKYLMIKKSKAYFINVDGKEKEIDTIGKEDILFLLEKATNPEVDFEIDELDSSNVKNEAHRIIYENISEKFKELLKNRNVFIDESESLYKDALSKYKDWCKDGYIRIVM